MKFFIEQVAIAPKDPDAAKQLLSEMGAQEWHEDEVDAKGEVFGERTRNVANLSFNYDIIGAREFEVLHYIAGENWVEGQHRVSHLGMHCTEKELEEWKKFFKKKGIRIAQEVVTQSHTNPVIKDKRFYHYVIFDTREILGVDLKFIVRLDLQTAERC